MSWAPDPEVLKMLQEQMAQGKTREDFQREAGEALLEREDIIDGFVETAVDYVTRSRAEGEERILGLADYYGAAMLEFREELGDQTMDPESLLDALLVAIYKLAEQAVDRDSVKIVLADTQHRKGS